MEKLHYSHRKEKDSVLFPFLSLFPTSFEFTYFIHSYAFSGLELLFRPRGEFSVPQTPLASLSPLFVNPRHIHIGNRINMGCVSLHLFSVTLGIFLLNLKYMLLFSVVSSRRNEIREDIRQ